MSRFDNRLDSNGTRISVEQAQVYFPEWDHVPYSMVASPADISNGCAVRLSSGTWHGMEIPLSERRESAFVWLRRVQIGPEFGTYWGELTSNFRVRFQDLSAGDWVAFAASNVWEVDES